MLGLTKTIIKLSLLAEGGWMSNTNKERHTREHNNNNNNNNDNNNSSTNNDNNNMNDNDKRIKQGEEKDYKK